MQLSRPSAVIFSVGVPVQCRCLRALRGSFQPDWTAHSVRGDLTHYRLKGRLLSRGYRSGEVFQTGALPFFEMTLDFIGAFEQFLQEHQRGWH